MQNLVQKGITLRYTNTGSELIPGGSLVVLPGCVGVAVKDIEPGRSQALNVVGVYELPKEEAAIALGAPVYVDGDGKISATPSDNPAGVAWEAAAPAALVAKVNINFGFAPPPPPAPEQAG
jgi:predicted RecA/RadA family phage recombinase